MKIIYPFWVNKSIFFLLIFFFLCNYFIPVTWKMKMHFAHKEIKRNLKNNKRNWFQPAVNISGKTSLELIFSEPFTQYFVSFTFLFKMLFIPSLLLLGHSVNFPNLIFFLNIWSILLFLSKNHFACHILNAENL